MSVGILTVKVYIVCFSLFASFALFEVYDFVRCRIEAGLDVGESIGVVEQKKDLPVGKRVDVQVLV